PIVDTILQRIHENLTLRKNRRNGKLDGPVGSFLICGNEGIGKRYLTRVLSKLLYRGAGVEVFDCRRVNAGQLLKTGGILARIVERYPHTFLLFEGVDGASDELLGVLTRIVTNGTIHDNEGNELSLRSTVIVLTTIRAVEELASADSSGTNGTVGQQRKTEVLSRMGMPVSLINGLQEILCCESPTPETSAEVVALVLKKECRDHGIDLCHVDPEIIATQVVQIDEAHGYELVPHRAKHLLRKPLVAAADKKQKSLALRVLRHNKEETNSR
ncbi:MAG: AAA family ATPase, partial [Planctomycetota bacterium]